MGKRATSVAYDLYTAEGEKLASESFDAICTAVEGDCLTRRQAMARAADAIERIEDIDRGMGDAEPFAKIAWVLSEAFESVGFKPVGADELAIAYEAWRKRGEMLPGVPVPTGVSAAGEAASGLERALAPLYGRSDGFVARVSGAAPFTADFTDADALGCDMSVFISTGDFTGATQVGCLLMSPTASAYLDDAVSSENLDRALDAIYPDRTDIERTDLAPALTDLASALDDFNLAVAMLKSPERLSVSLSKDVVPPKLVAMWDGNPISSVRRTPASAPVSKTVVRSMFVSEPADDADQVSETFCSAASPTR